MRGYPVVVSLVFAGVASWTAVATATPPVAGDPYRAGSRLYVWAVQGINLRQRPSASAPVVDRLAYGTPVTVSKQDEPPVPHRLEFFPPRNAAETLTQIAQERPRVPLDGRWIKIEARQRDGYAFDKLLLRWPPKNPDEAIETYLVRAFELTAHRRQKRSRKDEESGLRYTTIYRTWTSKENRVVLKTEESDGDASTRGWRSCLDTWLVLRRGLRLGERHPPAARGSRFPLSGRPGVRVFAGSDRQYRQAEENRRWDIARMVLWHELGRIDSAMISRVRSQ